jgi:hypothetical protein
MGWIPHSSTYYQTQLGSYCYIPSCHATKAATSQGSERAMFIRCRDAPGTFDRVSALSHRERREGQTGGEIPFAHTNHRVEK